MEWTKIDVTRCPTCGSRWMRKARKNSYTDCSNRSECGTWKVQFENINPLPIICKQFDDGKGWYYVIEWDLTNKKCKVSSVNMSKGAPVIRFDFALPFTITLEKLEIYLLFS